MTSWVFRTPAVAEGPASRADRLFIRLKIPRGVSVLEAPQGVFQALRFPTQDEIAAAVTTYMGGHEFTVNDATRAALIAAGVGVDASNFTPIQDGTVGVSTVNGDPGPDVILIYSEVGANKQLVVRRAYVTSGNIIIPSTGGTWAALTGMELDLPAAVGDYVELTASFMYQPAAASFIDAAVISGATLKRYASSGGSSPTTANGTGEGDPSLYSAPGTYRTSGFHFGFTVAAGDLDTGNVRFVMAALSGGAGAALYASTDYPFRWTAKNYGPVL